MILIVIILIISLDQLSKSLVTKNLLLNQSIPIIKNIFHLSLIHNRGAAFGILKGQVSLFIFTSILAIILIYLNLKNISRKGILTKKARIESISLGFIFSGALGNLIDRLIFGYVVDFLDFRIWPVFNVADCAITTGAILLACCLFMGDKNFKTQNPLLRCIP